MDARSDVYSLGVIFYEMLTGRVPYEAETPMAVVIKRITAPLPLPRKINPDIPEAVERVILKALAKAPADRYQSAGELAGTLKKAAGVVEKKAVPVVAPTEEGVPFWRRVPLWAWGAVGGVVLLLVGWVLLAGLRPMRALLALSTPTPTSTWAPSHVSTYAPTATPTGTLTPPASPNYTPVPTDTPLPPMPTDTPEPTPTCTPPPTPTDTPSPPTPTPFPTPSGGRIAFVSRRDSNGEIYVMNADGSGQTNLTNHPDYDLSPSWSPDGTRIAFHSFRDGNGEIYVMNADGSGVTRLTNNPADDWYPSWGP